MGQINWREKLGWDVDQLEDLRFTGYAYIRQGKYDIALPFFEALCVLKTDDPYDSQTLGALYLQLNQPEQALKQFDRALKLEGDHGPTLLNVAKAFFMMGKKSEGIKLVEILTKEKDPYISNMAKALLLAWS